MKLQVGDNAPEINALASDGSTVVLSSFTGQKNVVLYFYPKDDTPGCTVEACAFRDAAPVFGKRDAVVLGVSPDGLKSHQKFVTKFGLPFLLLCDEGRSICKAYDVLVEKNMYGRKYIGVGRTTFVIGKSGKIAAVFEKVSPKGHEQEVLEALKTL